ncbi:MULTISPECIES: CvpA family protein [unclassified Enterococcus]|uniref:CvpA family protein n=1 Tax=unclassified Enterococcus TaxID=2608891 RepID=UPI0015519C83|nr:MULTISPECIES: CvpA family protein [unclassified Enterococcus]MBS7577644.1 CvpA family protein [Enterococcus sp. MMGLQ5-2]MBS7584162.1 CvpA family protein [Enterococcus sp. MMGLQ5-1]NPD12020.1 CvpA family protein [Enterococcus sp. MMGLQ5-1]NPD37477.1 CvpA family protein [Enterococcus sp. MMGLQ5-2]
MISLIILIFLAIGFSIGYFRGFALQAYYIIGTLIAYLIATILFTKYAKVFTLWVPFPSASEGSKLTILNQSIIFDLNDVFYAAFAFMLIFIIVLILVRVLGIFAYPLGKLKVLGKHNHWVGGVLGVLESYLVILLFLAVLALIPINNIQNALSNSLLAKAMLLRTPIFSHDIFNSWVTEIINQKPF